MGRVGIGVQPLQGENYTYSRVFDHEYSYPSVVSSSLVLLDFNLPLVPLSCSDSSWGAGSGSSRTDIGLDFDGVSRPEPVWPVSRSYGWHTYACCLHRKPQPIHWLLLYLYIYSKLAYGWWPGHISSLGIVWQDAGSDQEFDTNDDGWYNWSLGSPCYAQVLPVERKFKMKDGMKTSYRYRYLFVMIQPNGLVIKDSHY